MTNEQTSKNPNFKNMSKEEVQTYLKEIGIKESSKEGNAPQFIHEAKKINDHKQFRKVGHDDIIKKIHDIIKKLADSKDEKIKAHIPEFEKLKKGLKEINIPQIDIDKLVKVTAPITDVETAKGEKEIADDAEKLEVEISQKEKVFKLLIERYGQIKQLDQQVNEGNLPDTIAKIHKHLEDITNGLKGILARHKNNLTNVAIAKGHDSFKLITEITKSLDKKGITLKKYREIMAPINKFPMMLCKNFAYELEVTVDANIIKIDKHINSRDKSRPETVKVYAQYINVYRDILIILYCITRDQTISSTKISADIEKLDTSTTTTKKLKEELSRITADAAWLYRVYQQLKQH